jgi:transposase
VINVDETRWAIMGSPKPAAGTVWGVHAPGVSFYRILPGKSADEGREVLVDYSGIAVVDGFAVYEVLARDGPGFTLAPCWAHTKRKYDEIATNWPTACAEIGELYTIERLVAGPFPGDAAAQALRQQLRAERSQPILDRIWNWAAEQVGLPCSDFGKAVRYMLERWTGLTRFVTKPGIPLDNNAAARALRGPVVGRKNHYGSRSLRGTQVAALFYTLCDRETGRHRSARVSAARALRCHREAWRHQLSRRSPNAAAGIGKPFDLLVDRMRGSRADGVRRGLTVK